MSFLANTEAVKVFLDHKHLSQEFELFCLLIQIHPFLAKELLWVLESQTGWTFGPRSSLPVVVAMFFCLFFSFLFSCLDQIEASGRQPELLFVKDKWKSQGGTETTGTDTEREHSFIFCFILTVGQTSKGEKKIPTPPQSIVSPLTPQMWGSR